MDCERGGKVNAVPSFLEDPVLSSYRNPFAFGHLAEDGYAEDLFALYGTARVAGGCALRTA